MEHMSEEEKLAKHVIDIAEFIKVKYHISSEDAKRTSTLISQLKMGYILTIYTSSNIHEIMNGQICTVGYDMDNGMGKDVAFYVSVHDASITSIMGGVTKPQTRKILLEEFVQMCVNMLGDKFLSLSMDLKWEDLKGE